jgi:hypothetical protein
MPRDPYAMLKVFSVALAAYTPLPVYIPTYPLEKFTWLTWHLKGYDLDLVDLSARIRESPFAPATDINGFWWLLQTAGYKEVIKAEGIHVLRGKSIMCLFWYGVISTLLKILQDFLIFDILINIFMIHARSLPRWYSFLSSWYWVVTGEVSRPLASLMPRDPYAMLKVFSVALAAYTPLPIAYLIGWITPVQLLAFMNDLLASTLAWSPLTRVTPSPGGLMTNPWMTLIDEVTTLSNDYKQLERCRDH